MQASCSYKRLTEEKTYQEVILYLNRASSKVLIFLVIKYNMAIIEVSSLRTSLHCEQDEVIIANTE